MLTNMAAFAQLERDTMIERTRIGLAAVAASNLRGGRPATLPLPGPGELKGKDISAFDIGKMLGVSRATAYRYPS